MSGMIIDATEEREALYGTAVVQDPSRVLLDDCDDAIQIRKTRTAALPHITPAVPHSGERSLKDRVKLGPVENPVQIDAAPLIPEVDAKTVDGDALKEIEIYRDQLAEIQNELDDPNSAAPHELRFPNLAWESVLAGLAKEQMTNNQLQEHIKEAEKHQKDIDLLLDLSAELSGLKDDQKEMPEKVQNLLGQLKERGIDLWKSEGKEISKEKIGELKSLSSGQVDKLRSNLQILFTTKIQTLVQSIGAILECVKDIVRNNTKLINAANRLPGH